MSKGIKKVSKKVATKAIVKVPNAKLYVTANLKNTILSITDLNGQVKAWSSCGANGFTNCRKKTPHANNTTFQKTVQKMKELGVNVIHEIIIRGVGSGRDILSIIISLCVKESITVLSLVDKTNIAFNGTRAPRVRRQ